jgi:hypothetical protein
MRPGDSRWEGNDLSREKAVEFLKIGIERTIKSAP